jgi:cell division protein FtsQ
MSALAATVRRLRVVAPSRVSIPGSPWLKRRVAYTLAAVLLLAGAYMVWFRNSGLVAVEKVQVSGLTGKDARRARAALEGAGRETTTLNVDRGSIEQAAQAFPVIRALEITPDFPSGLRIRVLEHRPTAVLVSGDRRVPVAGDGSILTGLPLGGSLPTIDVKGAVPSRRLGSGSAMGAVRVAGTAPAVLTHRLASIQTTQSKGVVVKVSHGPDLIFGTTARLHAKWAAAARVLADPDAAGAEYIDLRIPERPAAGGLAVETVAPVAPAGAPDPEQTAPTSPATGQSPVAQSPATGAPTGQAQPVQPQAQTAPATPQAQPPAPATQGGGATAPNTQP